MASQAGAPLLSRVKGRERATPVDGSVRLCLSRGLAPASSVESDGLVFIRGLPTCPFAIYLGYGEGGAKPRGNGARGLDLRAGSREGAEGAGRLSCASNGFWRRGATRRTFVFTCGRPLRGAFGVKSPPGGRGPRTPTRAVSGTLCPNTLTPADDGGRGTAVGFGRATQG